MRQTEEQFYRQEWMTDDQWRCAKLIADIFGGFNHIKTPKQWANGVRVIIYQNELSTFDFNHLSELVIAAHLQCIRISVGTAGMRLCVLARPRVRTGGYSKRHPSLDEVMGPHMENARDSLPPVPDSTGSGSAGKSGVVLSGDGRGTK